MKVTILGCGGSGGVPLIGYEWGACDPNEPRNRRTRVSILVEEGPTSILVDTSPDMREQLLSADIRDLTAIFFTHAHADHSHGIDNIRSLNWFLKKTVPVYAKRDTMTDLRQRFGYIFDTDRPKEKQFYIPSVDPHIIEDQPITLDTIRVTAFDQEHGSIFSTGYRFNDFGYSTDAGELNDAAFEALKGIKVWVLGAIRDRPHHAHAHIDKAIEWIERVGPERAYLTHMDQSLDYRALKARLPRGIEPAYDGLVIEV